MKQQEFADQTRTKGFAGKVADTFILSGRPGIVVVPVEAWAVPIKVGDTLRLVKPNGATSTVRVGGIEMPNPSRLDGKNPLLLIAENLSKTDVPKDTTVWLD